MSRVRKLEAAVAWAAARLDPQGRATLLEMAGMAPTSPQAPIAAPTASQRAGLGRWQPVATVASDSEPGHAYQVKRNRMTGAYGCDCLGYRFSRETPKSCKHILAVFGEPVGSLGAQPDSRGDTYERRSVNNERFTVRRAISFGELS